MARSFLALSLPLVLVACGKAPPEANPEFSDAAVFALRAFDDAPQDLAFGIRALEEQIYLGMDVEADNPRDRALTPSNLTEADIVWMTDLPADPEDALPVAVAGLSKYDVAEQTPIQLLVDQTPVEPYSPNYFEREFYEDSEDCWSEQTCSVLYTGNDLIKENFLMTVPYFFYKDFRWVDLNLPDPVDVPEGEEAVNDGDERWAYVARSWMTEVGEGENGNSRILQAYTLEAWIPRDGQGFVRDGTEDNIDDGEWTTDSTGGGTLHLLSLWSETEFDGINPSEDVVAATTRSGIDDNMKAQEEWLDEYYGD